MSRSCSGLNARWSSVTSQCSLMIVGMPGPAVTVPIVATPPRSIADSRAARPKRAGGQERVVAQVHRRRARVAGLAGERDRVALDAEAADHGRGGLARLLQPRALLDVQLEIGGDVGQLGLAHRVEVDVVLLQRVRERDALVVLEVADRVGVERARRGGGAEQAAPEARALLVGPVDQLQRDRGRLALVRAQHLDRGQQAEAAVEPAAVRHGVDVRADDDDLLALAGDRRPQVPGDVALDRGVGLGELAEQPLARRAPVLAPRQPARAVRPTRQLRQLVQVLERTLPVEVRHARHDRRNSGARAGFFSRMIRWRRIIGVSLALFALHTGTADGGFAVRAGRARELRQGAARGGLRGPRGDGQAGGEDAAALHAAGPDAGRACAGAR